MNQSNLRQYDCDNMIYCYACNYINKYASEIYHIFNALISHPSTKKIEYNILSIGCGDCADLFGVKQFLNDNGRTPSFSYTGIDMNTRWQPIHEQINLIFPTININFGYQDVFEYIDSLSLDVLPYNIVILEYVLNEIRKYTPATINSFIDCFVHKIIDKLPPDSLIIINDINYYMVEIYQKIELAAKTNNNITANYVRFRNPIRSPHGGYTLPNDS